MNLKHLSSEDLLSEIKKLVSQERDLLTKILWHLYEVESRRLFAERGFGSLFECAVKELNYSEAAAGRRIAVMRLLKSVPETESAISSGRLSLSTASTLQVFFQNEKREQKKVYSSEQKIEIIQAVEGKSQRECERILVGISPQSVKVPECIKPINAEKTELRLVVDQSLIEDLEKLKKVLSHRLKDQSMSALLKYLTQDALKRLDLETKEKNKVIQIKFTPTSESESKSKSKHSRYIPAQVRHSVRKRAAHQCEYFDPKTNRRCTSRYKLEFEHCEPFALDGEHTTHNLKLFCRAHNVFRATQTYGDKKMSLFANGH